MEDDSSDLPPRAESLLPYDRWTEDALRQVVSMAIGYVAQNGLPGEHHFYISFRTDAKGVSVPARVSAQYPGEMTIVLQHQFWDLRLEEAGQQFTVGLSFGGIPATLVIPLAAVTGFHDPHVQFGLRFRPPDGDAAEETADVADEDARDKDGGDERGGGEAEAAATEDAPQVVSLDAFRKRTPNKES